MGPDVSPMKFYLQCCHGLPPSEQFPAVLFWSSRCEVVRVDGGRDGPQLRLVPAGVLLTTAQLVIMEDEGQVHVLDIRAVQAAEEDPTASTLLTVASVAGQVWQLQLHGDELGELLAHIQRARRLVAVALHS